MLEIMIGLSAAVCILIVYVVYLIKKGVRLSEKLKAAECALDIIDNAHNAITKQIEKEMLENDDNEDLIISRNYFSD